MDGSLGLWEITIAKRRNALLLIVHTRYTPGLAAQCNDALYYHLGWNYALAVDAHHTILYTQPPAVLVGGKKTHIITKRSTASFLFATSVRASQ
jgi:hypothetical protein